MYGHPEVARRHESWSLIQLLKINSPNAWLIFGDVNEIVNYQEKRGGRSERQNGDFQEVIDDSGLFDLGYTGANFTWCNGRDGQ